MPWRSLLARQLCQRPEQCARIGHAAHEDVLRARDGRATLDGSDLRRAANKLWPSFSGDAPLACAEIAAIGILRQDFIAQRSERRSRREARAPAAAAAGNCYVPAVCDI